MQPTNTGSPSSSPNKAAIAAGVVVGLLAVIAAVSGGAFLYRRRQRNRQVEEEYRRNAANSSFGAGSKPNSGSSFSDTRLDPTVMAQRRMSDGSIADNQDYSRRILKVCYVADLPQYPGTNNTILGYQRMILPQNNLSIL